MKQIETNYLICLRQTIYLLVVILVITGCNVKPEVKIVEVEAFPKEYLVKGAKTVCEELSCPHQMIVCGSVLLCVEKCNDRWLYIYDLESNRLLSRLFGHGKGPYEYPKAPWILDIWVDDSGEDYFSLADQIRSIIYIYSVKNLLNGSLEPTKQYKLPSTIPTRTPQRLNDSIWIGSAQRQEGSLFSYNWNLKSVTNWKKRVPIDFFVDPTNRYRVNDEAMRLNNKSGVIVSSLKYLKRIYIYNSELVLTHIIRDKKAPRNPDFSKPNMASYETVLFYEEPILSSKYIGIINYQYTKEYQPDTELLIFDYQGNPQEKYIFDQPFSCSAIDWERKRLYCMSQLDYRVMYYDLIGLE